MTREEAVEMIDRMFAPGPLGDRAKVQLITIMDAHAAYMIETHARTPEWGTALVIPNRRRAHR